MLVSFLKILHFYASFISKNVNKFTNGKPNCAVLKKEIKMCMDVMPKSKHSKLQCSSFSYTKQSIYFYSTIYRCTLSVFFNFCHFYCIVTHVICSSDVIWKLFSCILFVYNKVFKK